MALQTPSNLYSGYAQVFNEAPHVAFRTRLMQQHEAKMTALDDYYRKMPLLINEKGVRDQERPDIAKSMLGIKDFYIQNKDRLRNGDQASAFNYEKMLRDHQDLVGKSQAAGMVDAQVGKLKFNPSVQYMFQSPETIEQLSRHHLPITDPNHQDFDLETFTAPPKPLDLATFMRPLDKMKYDEVQKVTKNDDFTETVTTFHVPSNEAKSTIMAKADFEYVHNPSFKKAVDQFPSDNTNPYNEIFKEYYGRDIVTPFDAGAALIAANKVKQPTTVKRVLDRSEFEAHKDADWLKRNSISFEQQKQIAAIRREAGIPPPETGYLSDEVAFSVAEDEPILMGGKNKASSSENRKVIYADKVDPERLNIIIGFDPSKSQTGVYPIEILQPDGTYRQGYFQDQTTGDWIGKGNQRISREAVKDRYVNKFSPSAFKAKINTKAEEGKKAAAQKPKSILKGNVR